ncbi:WASH complex subunit 1-like [Brevipalpus obovatus]|uniref:WASH complex subunit 1-like n=1 Tax=Brevipalpus obovatus TaxID=246614 RepID=UPI003D9E672D
MYEVEIIPQDIREEEAIHRILDTMKDLRTIMDTIFVNIDSKIDQFQDRLKGIDSRCEQAQQMINKLQGAGGKVTRIFSEFKFPAKDVFKSYSPLSQAFTSPTEPVIRKMKSAHVPFDDELLRTKIQFPIALSDKDSSYNSIVGSEAKQVPWSRIKNIGSLVMFNSSENPYAASPIAASTVDNKAKNRKHLQNTDDDDAITNLAPTKLLTKDQLDQDDFIRYNPDSQLAPKIMDDLPSALPHLSGIADGLLFNETTESLASNQQDLPDLSRIGSEPSTETPKVNTFKDEKSLPPLPGSAAIPPPPPPPPPASFFLSPETSLNKASVTGNSQSSSIPPPPPLPPILPPDLSGSEKVHPPNSALASATSPPPLPPSIPSPSQPSLPSSTDAGTTQKKIPAITNDREGLLASIRDAGGRPARKPGNIKERKIEEKKKDQAEIQGDIMSALQKKLNDRRKGISGRNLEPGADRTSLMEAADLMKSKLPQPPSSASSSDLSEADWDDI